MRSEARFRGRIGRVEYALQDGLDESAEEKQWIVAVKRRDMERVPELSYRKARAAENCFEFLSLKASQLHIAQGQAAERPDWVVPSFEYKDEPIKENAVRGVLGVQHKRAHRIGLIVPFRDLHASQKRAQQLAAFVPHYTKLFSRQHIDYRILIIEQNPNDGYKFNRGQLLNIGFRIAKHEFACDSFIFHDVDLLSDLELAPFYTIQPDVPVHIARRWDRYSGNPDYFGGIAAWSALDFECINGFPNNYWGWGGEDDEMMRRCKTVWGEAFTMDAPCRGEIIDLENMDLDQKLTFLRQHDDWKNNIRWELRDEHLTTWETNGLRRAQDGQSFHFNELARSSPLHGDERALKITVQCSLHSDWTDKYAPSNAA